MIRVMIRVYWLVFTFGTKKGSQTKKKVRKERRIEIKQMVEKTYERHAKVTMDNQTITSSGIQIPAVW